MNSRPCVVGDLYDHLLRRQLDSRDVAELVPEVVELSRRNRGRRRFVATLGGDLGDFVDTGSRLQDVDNAENLPAEVDVGIQLDRTLQSDVELGLATQEVEDPEGDERRQDPGLLVCFAWMILKR